MTSFVLGSCASRSPIWHMSMLAVTTCIRSRMTWFLVCTLGQYYEDSLVVHHSIHTRHSSTYAVKNYKTIRTFLYLNQLCLSVFRLRCHIVIATTRIILDAFFILACSLVPLYLPDLCSNTLLPYRIGAYKVGLKITIGECAIPILRVTTCRFHDGPVFFVQILFDPLRNASYDIVDAVSWHHAGSNVSLNSSHFKKFLIRYDTMPGV